MDVPHRPLCSGAVLQKCFISVADSPGLTWTLSRIHLTEPALDVHLITCVQAGAVKNATADKHADHSAKSGIVTFKRGLYAGGLRESALSWALAPTGCWMSYATVTHALSRRMPLIRRLERQQYFGGRFQAPHRWQMHHSRLFSVLCRSRQEQVGLMHLSLLWPVASI